MMLMPENSALYSLMEAAKLNLMPYREILKNTDKLCHKVFGAEMENSKFLNILDANFEMMERLTRHYSKPEFGIDEIEIKGKKVKIHEDLVKVKSFCHLKHFRKEGKHDLPKLLIVAPMSGHHATLLRDTVRGTLAQFDVYITDWLDAKNVAVSKGTFDLDDYIDYVIEFMENLAPNLHVLAVCQPTVPVLAAVSIMSSSHNDAIPKSMILMGGPIDARKSPTFVNELAVDNSIAWFSSKFISRVPHNYEGYMRPVYPGFVQIANFVSMNALRHVNSHLKLYNTIIDNDEESASRQREFYDEYFASMDITAEFYLQTVQSVFQDFDLPLGKMYSRGRHIDLSAIKKTALLGIEGENDDISGIGQTSAALHLCVNIPKAKKHYYMQKGVGHYGVFSGRKFREVVVPEIHKFVSSLE